MTNIDQKLVVKSYEHTRRLTAMTFADRVAANLLWREDSAAARGPKPLRVSTLARAFNVVRNTLYYHALTAKSAGYLTNSETNLVEPVEREIELLGVEKAWQKYVTPEIIERVNATLKAEVERRKKC